MGATATLLGLLKQQQDVLARLQALCAEQRECILGSDIIRLDVVTQQQQSLLAAQAALSTRITRVLEGMCRDLALDGPPSLARLAETLTGDDSRQVRQFHQDIRRRAAEIQRDGRLNWYLAQQALRYIDFTLKLVGHAQDGPQPYLHLHLARSQRAQAMHLLMDDRA